MAVNFAEAGDVATAFKMAADGFMPLDRGTDVNRSRPCAAATAAEEL